MNKCRFSASRIQVAPGRQDKPLQKCSCLIYRRPSLEVATLSEVHKAKWWRCAVQLINVAKHDTMQANSQVEVKSMHRLRVWSYKVQWSLYIRPGLTFNNCTFCPYSVFMCFVWIWEQTAIISLYSINWLVCITETECLLRGTDWVFIYRQFNIQQFYVLPTQCIYVFCVDLRTNSDYFPIQH